MSTEGQHSTCACAPRPVRSRARLTDIVALGSTLQPRFWRSERVGSPLSYALAMCPGCALIMWSHVSRAEVRAEVPNLKARVTNAGLSRLEEAPPLAVGLGRDVLTVFMAFDALSVYGCAGDGCRCDACNKVIKSATVIGAAVRCGSK